MLALLRREVTFGVNRKRVQRLLGVLGLNAIYPQRPLSHPAPGHEIYPYLLRDVVINSVNHVWSSDITYVRLQDGFGYLAAVIDWFSRFVLSWAVFEHGRRVAVPRGSGGRSGQQRAAANLQHRSRLTIH